LLGIVARPYWHNPATEGSESLVQLTTAIANPNVRKRRPKRRVVASTSFNLGDHVSVALHE
jgi:hypothetical protein